MTLPKVMIAVENSHEAPPYANALLSRNLWPRKKALLTLSYHDHMHKMCKSARNGTFIVVLGRFRLLGAENQFFLTLFGHEIVKKNRFCTTRPVCRVSHRKLRETKQEPSRARTGYQISCCLVSLHFLCDILHTGPV